MKEPTKIQTIGTNLFYIFSTLILIVGIVSIFTLRTNYRIVMSLLTAGLLASVLLMYIGVKIEEINEIRLERKDLLQALISKKEGV